MTQRQNILITGASAGLGAGMAREFAGMGRHLALCARRGDRLDALGAELGRSAPAARVVSAVLDVDDHARVFEVFHELSRRLGGIDRVIVNAGVGGGVRIGHDGPAGFEANAATLNTNVVSALAQCEAAMTIFRAQGHGHLVVVSSMSAFRGMPGRMAAYAASKACVATLAEGIRAEMLGSRIRVTTLFPGYIRTDMNAKAKRLPFAVDAAAGSRALVRAIEREPATACVPAWPWKGMSWLMQALPLRMAARLA